MSVNFFRANNGWWNSMPNVGDSDLCGYGENVAGLYSRQLAAAAAFFFVL